MTATTTRRITLRSTGYRGIRRQCSYVRYLGTIAGNSSVGSSDLVRELWQTEDGVEFELHQPDSALPVHQIREVYVDAGAAEALGMAPALREIGRVPQVDGGTRVLLCRSTAAREECRIFRQHGADACTPLYIVEIRHGDTFCVRYPGSDVTAAEWRSIRRALSS
jgi:hypothetical protein